MRLDVVYTCEACGAISADSMPMGAEVARFDRSPFCGCARPDITSYMELHTRDETT